MSDPRIGSLLLRAARLLARPTTADGDLVDRFVRHRDPAAFAELVARHGPVVWAVARRQTRTEADAEDVFQATFLVLARRAGSVRTAASVGSWLHGVAVRLGREARTRFDRRPDPRRLGPPAAAHDPAGNLAWAEVRAALDEELARLPDRLRAPLLLCYLDGRTQDEAAAVLGWKPRTVKARVARGRALLRDRLARRGVGLPAALSAPLLAAGFASAVPPRPAAVLAAAAAEFARNRPPVGVSAAAVELARSGLSAVPRAFLAAAAVSAIGLLAVGGTVALDPGRAAVAPAPADGPVDPPAPARRAEAPDALPPGAVARIGTAQWRQASWHKRVFFTRDATALVATDGDSNTVRFWNAASGRPDRELELPGAAPRDADYFAGGDFLAVFGRDTSDGGRPSALSVWLVDAAAAKVVRTLRIPDAVHSIHHAVRFTPDGKRLVTATDAELRVWDAGTGDELIRQKVRDGTAAFAVSPDGKSVAFGRYDVFLWNWADGRDPVKVVGIGGSGTELCAFAPDGKALFTSGAAGLLTAWELPTGRRLRTIDLGGTPRHLAFSPDGRTLAVGYYETNRSTALENSVALFDPASGREQARFPLGRDNAEFVSWSADGARLAAGSGYRVWAWDAATGRPLTPDAGGHEGAISTLAFAPDGRLFTASDDHTVRSWDAATGRPGLELIHAYWVRGLAVSPDGASVAGSALRNDLRVWNAKTGELRFRLLGNGQSGGKRLVRFTPDGGRLVAWGDDRYLRTWDTRNGKLVSEHRIRPAGFPEPDEADLIGISGRMAEEMFTLSCAAEFSPDGTTFVLGIGPSLQAFDVATGLEKASFKTAAASAVVLAVSPDGRRVAVAGRGKPVETPLPRGGTRSSMENEHPLSVLNLADGSVVWTARAAGSNPLAVGFSPDGSRIAECAGDAQGGPSVRFRDAAAGREVGRLDLPWIGYALAFDRTGKRLAVAGRDTTALVYDLDAAVKPTGSE